MKSFDLEKALAGEPVVLKNGLKAYVIKVLNKPEIGMHELIGFFENENERQQLISWFIDGTRYGGFEITGMWEEPKTKLYINGIEIPKSITIHDWIDGETYWHVCLTTTDFVAQGTFYKNVECDKNLINSGLVFKTKEDAMIMAKALFNFTWEYK